MDLHSEIKGIISHFTKEKPLIVNSNIYRALEKEGLVPDDRIILQKRIPIK